MNKNSASLWLMIGRMPISSGCYGKVGEIKLSGMKDMGEFLKTFVPLEKEGEDERRDFSSLSRKDRDKELASPLGVKQTPYFYVRDYDADFSQGEETAVSISEFLEDYM
jgi:hypothetical protein